MSQGKRIEQSGEAGLAGLAAPPVPQRAMSTDLDVSQARLEYEEDPRLEPRSPLGAEQESELDFHELSVAEARPGAGENAPGWLKSSELSGAGMSQAEKQGVAEEGSISSVEDLELYG